MPYNHTVETITPWPIYITLPDQIQPNSVELPNNPRILIHHLGGTKGIGRSIVQSFLKEGATVHFCSRTASDVKAANERYAAEISDAKAIGNIVDVTNGKRLRAWVEDCAKESSRIDVVVANVSSLSHEVSMSTEKGV